MNTCDSVQSPCSTTCLLRQDPAANARVLCRCSFLEIYNETISDLLAPGAAPLAVREDLRRGVYVEGLCEEVVSCSARPIRNWDRD